MGPLVGAVLAGGASTRMGRDKALLELHGELLIERALRLLRSLGLEPVIAGTRRDLAAFAPVLDDPHPRRGPLSGIEAALAFAAAGGADGVLVLAVDMPLLPRALPGLLLERALLTGALATVPTLLSRPQPLCSVWSTALLPAVTAALDACEHKVMASLFALRPGELDLFAVEAIAAARCDWAVLPPVHRWFDNLNTPRDFARATRRPASTTLEER